MDVLVEDIKSEDKTFEDSFNPKDFEKEVSCHRVRQISGRGNGPLALPSVCRQKKVPEGSLIVWKKVPKIVCSYLKKVSFFG